MKTNFKSILIEAINDYCEKNNIQWFEINWEEKYVAYFTDDSYSTFNYLDVDLF